MRVSARAIVIKDDQLLVMERHKMGQHYFTLLGGAVEPGETPEQAALREVKEESTVDISNPTLMFIEDSGSPFGQQQIFLCEYLGGDPVLPEESEEAFWSSPGKNTYKPMWLPISKLSDVPFVSPLLKQALVMAFTHGFPKEVYRFSSKHSSRLS